MQQPNSIRPVNPLPPVVIVLFAAIALVEVALSLGQRGILGGAEAVGWRLTLIRDYGFYAELLQLMIERSTYPLSELSRIVTYPFVHGSFTHAVFTCVFVLALGKYVGEVFSTLAVLIVFFGSAIMGALIYTAFMNNPAPLIGAFPAAYGLIGAFTYIMWLRLESLGENQLVAFRLIGFLMGIQLVFGLLFGSDGTWLADVGGFATGFLLSFLVKPGGLAELISRMRRD